jgi:hypothetical protein
MTDDLQHGRPLAIDASARSASPTEPAFIARPTPVYYDFVVLDDVNVDGFTLDHRLGSGALRNRRCVRDCPRRKSGWFGLGGLRPSVLPRDYAYRS